MNQDLIIFFLRLGILALLYLFLAQIALLILKDLKPSAKQEPSRKSTKSGDVLVVLDGGLAGLETGGVIPLGAANSFGRATGNTIRLPDDFVSAQHAILNSKQNTWWIEDLGSTNGTFVNGKQINKPTKVVPGDLIQIGTSKLRIDKR